MKILIADDDKYLNKLLQMRLSNWGYNVIAVNNGREAMNILLEEDGPKLAILDWMMPEMDGINVCKEIRSKAGENYIYIILLTARDQMSDFLEGMEAGADDFMTKPFKDQELRARLRAGLRILDLQDDLVTARDAIQYQANHDPLTGRWTRAAIFEILEKEICRSVREDSVISVMMIDLDHFKDVNDQFGHLAGDEVLRETVKRLQNSLRPYDSIGRYGGEEFLVVLPGCKEKDATHLAERMRDAISKEPILLGENEITITCSIGISMWQSGRPVLSMDIIEKADKALYKAKNAGRNKVEICENYPVE
ncbi:MAG: diguanylate cyclase [Calditrichaeota bacterium]|nr:MAG: diguanylate cyclase [Calditrichota bacterium]